MAQIISTPVKSTEIKIRPPHFSILFTPPTLYNRLQKTKYKKTLIAKTIQTFTPILLINFSISLFFECFYFFTFVQIHCFFKHNRFIKQRIILCYKSNIMRTEEKEKLFLNALPFDFPKEPITFYFTTENKADYRLIKLNNALFPHNIQSIFHERSLSDKLYTSFDRPIDGLKPLQIDFTADNFSLVKRYYNRKIKRYFNQIGMLVESDASNDNRVWQRSASVLHPIPYTIYNRFTIKVNLNHFTGKPELILFLDRPAKVLNKSVMRFLTENIRATADLFYKVVHVKYFQDNNGKRIAQYSAIKYKKLGEIDEEIDYQNVFPVIGQRLAAFLAIDQVEGANPENIKPYALTKNRYVECYKQISQFYLKFLDNEKFRAIIPLDGNGFSPVSPMQIGKVPLRSRQLLFGLNQSGEHHIEYLPQHGVSFGPFGQPKKCNNIQLFFVAHTSHFNLAITLADCLLNNYKNCFEGLTRYTHMPVSLTPKGFSILFNNIDDPLPEVEEALQNRIFSPTAKYIAIYLTPIGRYADQKRQFKIYYRIKERLLRRNIPSQCIDAYKMIKTLADDRKADRDGHTQTNFASVLQNMAIAINAKMGGIPWRTNAPVSKELVIGIGTFRQADSDYTYIGASFAFDNTGHFDSFAYFRPEQTTELAGAIENAIINYTKANGKPQRFIIHYFKQTNQNKADSIESVFNHLQTDIPFFLVTIYKTESEDLILFDAENPELLPYSGTYVDLGDQTFLLCNNARYRSDGLDAGEEFPFPLKIKITCSKATSSSIDRKTNEMLIDKIYQFSRICWKSLRQQNLPVTIKYPQMLVRIAPHFSTGAVPFSIDRDNLWFL